MTLELSRQMMRKRALDHYNHLRTCVLARELCLLIRTNRVVLNAEDVNECCGFIAKLCKEAGCEEPSELCTKAADAVTKSEETYLELCQQSCAKCSESRQPTRPRERESVYYVA